MKTVKLMLQNEISLRRALAYSGSSRRLYYYKRKERRVALEGLTVKRVKEVALERPSFGSRRMAAVLTKEMDFPVNRKKNPTHISCSELGFSIHEEERDHTLKC